MPRPGGLGRFGRPRRRLRCGPPVGALRPGPGPIAPPGRRSPPPPSLGSVVGGRAGAGGGLARFAGGGRGLSSSGAVVACRPSVPFVFLPRPPPAPLALAPVGCCLFFRAAAAVGVGFASGRGLRRALRWPCRACARPDARYSHGHDSGPFSPRCGCCAGGGRALARCRCSSAVGSPSVALCLCLAASRGLTASLLTFGPFYGTICPELFFHSLAVCPRPLGAASPGVSIGGKAAPFIRTGRLFYLPGCFCTRQIPPLIFRR